MMGSGPFAFTSVKHVGGVKKANSHTICYAIHSYGTFIIMMFRVAVLSALLLLAYISCRQ